MTCSYCKRQEEPGTGSILVKKDGKVMRFCSNKCRKNFLMKRNPKKMKWIVKKKKVKSEEKA